MGFTVVPIFLYICLRYGARPPLEKKKNSVGTETALTVFRLAT